MTSLSILEYRDIGSTGRGSVPIPLEPAIAEHAIELGAVSQQSRPFHPETCLVKLIASGDATIALGTDPDATNSSRHLPAGREQILAIVPNSKMKIAAIAAAGSSNMSDSLGAFINVIANPTAAKKNLDALTKQAATIDTAAANLKAATAEAAKGRTLAAWEAELAQREKAVTDADAKQKAKAAALAAAIA